MSRMRRSSRRGHSDPPQHASLLTQREHDLIALLGSVANEFAAIIGDGDTRNADYSEAVFYIHGLQHMVMSQAAARAYPEDYRKLGDVIST